MAPEFERQEPPTPTLNTTRAQHPQSPSAELGVPGDVGNDDELRHSELRYRNIFESAAVAVWEVNFSAAAQHIGDLIRSGMTDLEGHARDNPGFVRAMMALTIAVDVNQAALKMLGAEDKADLLGPVDKVWPVESEENFARTMAAAIERRPTFELETALRTLTGQNVEVLYSVNYPAETAALDSILVVFSNLTDRNRAQSEIQRSLSDTANANRLASLSELTASLAHELNQPLASIQSNAEAGLLWLRREQPDKPEAIASLEGVVEGSTRAMAVIAGVRALARKQENHVDRPLDRLINQVLLLLRGELERHEITLTTDLCANAHVRADKNQLVQVVTNIVLNAVEALAYEPLELRNLKVSSRIGGDEAIVSVADSGLGVDPLIRDHLFSAFVTTKSGRMGLGLSLCRTIVENHDGKLWATFGQDRGTTVHFSLPVSSVESGS